MRVDGELHTREVVAGALLSCVGLASFLLLPTLVEAAVSDLHYSEQQVGVLSAVLSTGQTVSGLASALWIRRCPWPLAAAISLVGLILSNGLALVAHGFTAFVVLQGVVGLFGGALYSLSLTMLSDGSRPERDFAYAIGAQTIYQIIAIVAGPALIRFGGANAILGLFIAMSAAGLLLLRWVPAAGRSGGGVGPAYGALLRGSVLLSLFGCFLFYANIGAFWTYVERIGSAAGLGLDVISNIVAFGTLTSLLGVMLASWLGTRRGYVAPIAASAVVIVACAALLGGRPTLVAYLSSNIFYSIAWNVSMTFQYSVVNAVDDSRRGVALAPSFHSAGGAAGPAIAALFVTESNHDGALWIVAVSVLASVACFWVSLRLHGPPGRRVSVQG